MRLLAVLGVVLSTASFGASLVGNWKTACLTDPDGNHYVHYGQFNADGSLVSKVTGWKDAGCTASLIGQNEWKAKYKIGNTLSNGNTELDILGMDVFHDGRYVIDTYGVFRIDGDTLRLSEFPEGLPARPKDVLTAPVFTRIP